MASRKYTSKLQDSLVLVIGGTSGMGFCVAEGALEQGASVVIASSRPARVDNALVRLRTSYPDVPPHKLRGYVLDLSQPDGLEARIDDLLRKTTEKTGSGVRKINHIVFTAGDALTLTPIADFSYDAFHALFQVRFVGFAFLAKLLCSGKYMDLVPENSLTCTGGTNSEKPMPGWTLGAAAGSAKEGMMRGLAVDLKPLRVNLVSAGAVVTELWDGLPSELREQTATSMSAQTTVGRLGRPEDLAEAYLYLMKDKFVTGTVLSSDGGRHLV